jgi:predicted transcriptional regulator
MGEANVRTVREALLPKRPLAYTTVMTMLDRLARKQAVSRKKVGRSFVYTPLISREDIRQLAVRELLDTLFDGSKDTLAAYLTGQANRYPAIMIEIETEAGAQRLDETLL